jgi:hypothetical protein
MLVAAGMTGAVAGGGCLPYRNAVDPCWPERYNHTARKEVVDAFAPQVQNGHVLDQTIWNWMFVTGTDELNGAGMYKLDYMIRRRPLPDPNVFLQTAHDVTFSVQEPDKVAELRRDLDQKRVAAIRTYLNAQTVGRPMAFDVAIHDPYPVGAAAEKGPGLMKTVNSVSPGATSVAAGGSANTGASATPTAVITTSTPTGTSTATSYGGAGGAGTGGTGSGSGGSGGGFGPQP